MHPWERQTSARTPTAGGWHRVCTASRMDVSQQVAAPPPHAGLAELRAAAADCRACDLWRDATQTVFGEGAARARLMLVGEQPGDQEDLDGSPFVGPSGALLDRALGHAGIDRRLVYVTNMVKHFKWKPRGKRRLHQTPTTYEIRACRPWLDAEIARRSARPHRRPRGNGGEGHRGTKRAGDPAARRGGGRRHRSGRDHDPSVRDPSRAEWRRAPPRLRRVRRRPAPVQVAAHHGRWSPPRTWRRSRSTIAEPMTAMSSAPRNPPAWFW